MKEQIEYVKTPSRYSGVAPTYFVGKIPFTQEISLDVENSIISGFPREKTPCALCWPLQTTISTIQYLALHTDGWKGTDIFEGLCGWTYFFTTLS